MRTRFSPTSEAARLFTTRDLTSRPAAGQPTAAPANPGQPGAGEERWCEWPRRAPTTRQFTSIWQTLRAIQAQHA